MAYIKHLLAVLAATAWLPVTASAQTVPDASFENHAVNGNYEYNPVDPGVVFVNAGVAASNNLGFGAAQSGGQFGFIQNATGVGSITFALSSLIVGHSYNVGFYLTRASGVPVDPLRVRLDGTALSNSANGQTLFVAPAGNGWSSFTTSSFTASAANAALSFTGTAELGGNFIVGIDSLAIHDLTVPVVPSVPEPASWALMIGGLGLTGAALRRRRARPVLA